jgi:putative nucleotidyltransferase with HDIG domain
MARVQRLEFAVDVTRDEYEAFLDEVLARVSLLPTDSATRSPERRSTIKFGAIGVKGSEGVRAPDDMLPTATIQYSLGEEADTIRWLHDEVQVSGELPLIEAESVVRSLSVAMHADRDIVIPLLQLKAFDQYTTTHSLNVSVLAMALAEFIGLNPTDVRAFGVAGLLHDLGKVRIPLEVLTKPGKLTDEEWQIMRRHPVEGARIIFESDRQLDVASAVAYEHHIMINGGGYPSRHFARDCHKASRLVHLCDVYDALRTNRPYREAWEAERVLSQIEKNAGPDFDADLARSFIQMMRQWEKRVAVVDDQTPLPHMSPSTPPPLETPAVAAAPTVSDTTATAPQPPSTAATS